MNEQQFAVGTEVIVKIYERMTTGIVLGYVVGGNYYNVKVKGYYGTFVYTPRELATWN